jgi:hypothetical protein
MITITTMITTMTIATKIQKRKCNGNILIKQDKKTKD